MIFRTKISKKLVYQYIANFFTFSPTSNHLHPLQVEDCDCVHVGIITAALLSIYIQIRPIYLSIRSVYLSIWSIYLSICASDWLKLSSYKLWPREHTDLRVWGDIDNAAYAIGVILIKRWNVFIWTKIPKGYFLFEIHKRTPSHVYGKHVHNCNVICSERWRNAWSSWTHIVSWKRSRLL